MCVYSNWRCQAMVIAILQIVGSCVVLIALLAGVVDDVPDFNMGERGEIVPAIITKTSCLISVVLGVTLFLGVIQENEKKGRIWLVSHCIFLLLEIISAVADFSLGRRNPSSVFPVVCSVGIVCYFLFVVNAYLEELLADGEKVGVVEKKQDPERDADAEEV
ncbi:hypothetical protein Fcan01_20357 [Folsomia candida]|uniref:Uncharacterized protein n=2 Tax=Folsomia candida TaxID=158441 RepID=A0A226DI70_FOLCA|nr:hypothetical protein Fcan01_20357 [Folsomia candida]